MNHLFIPYELAVIAKKTGFNEECLAFYLESEELVFTSYSVDNSGKNCQNSSLLPQHVSAPIYQQVIDWFRDNYQTWFWVNYQYHNDVCYYDYHLYSKLVPDEEVDEEDFTFKHTDYYKAFNEGIREMLKLIK